MLWGMKPALRRWARSVWRGLDRPLLSRKATLGLADFLRAQGVRHILLYHPLPHELDPRPLLELYPAQYYLPKVAGEGLTVHPYGPLAPGPFGLLEPITEAVDPGVLEAAVVPGLLFDRAGYRLGHGKGFYDRFLADLGPGVLTIGLIPEALVLPELPRDPWDQRVKYIATEKGVYPVLEHG